MVAIRPFFGRGGLVYGSVLGHESLCDCLATTKVVMQAR
jgi:hypothetical protein